MLYPSINEVRKKADSRYTLVILAAKRARDIIEGKPKLTEVEVDKPVSIAANEIAEDLITYRREEFQEN
ncbi:MAG: DNA-directed RNA polymerase subunit omega [Firmicutes bacterium]|jgi:DNA-directed RNA polymerase subunit omega|nr:DNA-directed RNA polymerase subunit omega [Bacillota bacterium]NBI62826.1 DNA-directed RNA polymerase subunit omega [Clostridiales bacterium]